MKDIFDKILFTVLASLLSTYILYSYNVYSKAFDAAQAQAHPYSTVANKLHSLIVDDLSKLTTGIKLHQVSGKKPLNEHNLDEMARLANSIQLYASVLENRLDKSSKIALDISQELKSAIPLFNKGNTFIRATVDEFGRDMEKRQASYMQSHFGEVASLFSSELKDFERAFNENVRWQARPETLLILSVGCIVAYLLYLGIARIWFRKPPLDS